MFDRFLRWVLILFHSVCQQLSPSKDSSLKILKGLYDLFLAQKEFFPQLSHVLSWDFCKSCLFHKERMCYHKHRITESICQSNAQRNVSFSGSETCWYVNKLLNRSEIWKILIWELLTWNTYIVEYTSCFLAVLFLGDILLNPSCRWLTSCVSCLKLPCGHFSMAILSNFGSGPLLSCFR